jgi:hypothetical protein
LFRQEEISLADAGIHADIAISALASVSNAPNRTFFQLDYLSYT